LRRLFGFLNICSLGLVLLVVGSIGLGGSGQSRRLDIENGVWGQEVKLDGILVEILTEALGLL